MARSIRHLPPALFAVPAVVIIILLAACSSSCGDSSDSGKKILTVSQMPQKYLLSAIVGDLYDINVLIPPSADPETFDPPMQALTDAGGSEAFFPVGISGLEKSISQRVHTNFPDLKIYDTTKGIRLIGNTHAPGEGDPHIFFSVANARIMAAEMLKAVEQLDPQHASTFRANYRALDARLDSLDADVRKALASAPSSFAIWHPSLSYFARDYNLNQIALETDGKETTPAQFRSRIDAIRRSDAKTMFAEPVHGTDRPATVAKETGLDMVEINVYAPDWEAEIRKIATGISGARKRASAAP